MKKVKLNLTTIWTDNVARMKQFYYDVLNIGIRQDLEKYVEFEDEGVHFAICERKLMSEYSHDYEAERKGQGFQISFICEDEEQMVHIYQKAIQKGGMGIQPPLQINPKQMAALFGDPDGNIHELCVNI